MTQPMGFASLNPSYDENKKSPREDMMGKLLACIVAAIAGMTAIEPASAQDKLKLTVGQRGNWDTSVSEIGQRAGIFKKHGLELEIVYTQGSGETQQPVVAG